MILMKEYYGLTVAEIADRLKDTPRNIYFFLEQAKKIGQQYRHDNEWAEISSIPNFVGIR